MSRAIFEDLFSRNSLTNLRYDIETGLGSSHLDLSYRLPSFLAECLEKRSGPRYPRIDYIQGMNRGIVLLSDLESVFDSGLRSLASICGEQDIDVHAVPYVRSEYQARSTRITM